MLFDRLWHEVKLAWKTLLVAPLLAAAPVGLIVALQRVHGENPAHALLAGIEMLLPVAAGVMVATTVAHDDALELHLTTPRPYDRTAMLRVLVIAGWTALLAAAATAGASWRGVLDEPSFAQAVSAPVRALVTELVWLAPLLWLVGIGLCLGMLTKSRTASGALLGGIWLLDILSTGVIMQTSWLRPFLLFPTTLVIYPASAVSRADFDTYWLNTRFGLLAMALALLPLGWLLLRNSEALLKGATEE